ncbi:hypothetical protein [Novosphingobium aquimarinum]|uniref:hypothetical protein n=1 Tax=Novosphingobium aquimarinum TaxID=2682494 RepID=UPI0012EB7B83|nr:hypothetical protein [Novosphingobium aquimarinum]
MHDEKARKRFALDDAQNQRTSFTMKDLPVRDQDNAKPVPKPPFQIDHLRLAPPGMAGTKTSNYKSLPISDKQIKPKTQQDPAARTSTLPTEGRLRLGNQNHITEKFKSSDSHSMDITR